MEERVVGHTIVDGPVDGVGTVWVVVEHSEQMAEDGRFCLRKRRNVGVFTSRDAANDELRRIRASVVYG